MLVQEDQPWELCPILFFGTQLAAHSQLPIFTAVTRAPTYTMRRLTASLGQTLALLALCLVLLIQRFYQDPFLARLQNNLNHGKDESSTPSSISTVPMSASTTPNPPSPGPTFSDLELQYLESLEMHKTWPTPPEPEQRPSHVSHIECNDKTGDPELFEKAAKYIQQILDPNIAGDYPRLDCPPLNKKRYSGLHHLPASTRKPRYFFALDLYQSAHLIVQLLGSMVEAIQFLGPELCAISIVEGRSTDGTYEILKSLEQDMKNLGVNYFLTCNEFDPVGEGMDRISTLAELRNQALRPLNKHPEQYDPSTTVIFLNDIAPCPEDILELIHQRMVLKADMTCAIDWINDGGTFYDVWIGRQMNGDLFFEIPQSTSWEFADNLFWSHDESRIRFFAGLPVQVFSCWNGAVALIAKPFLEGKVEFRSKIEGECYLGEPVHLAKDMWKLGHGKIAIVPSINVGYTVDDSAKAKEKHGTVSMWAEKEISLSNRITWKEKPPGQIKCVTSWDRPSWEPWDQGL